MQQMRRDLIRAIKGPSGSLLASVLVAALFGGAAIATPGSPFAADRHSPTVQEAPQRPAQAGHVNPKAVHRADASANATQRGEQHGRSGDSHRRGDDRGRRAPQGDRVGAGTPQAPHDPPPDASNEDRSAGRVAPSPPERPQHPADS